MTDSTEIRIKEIIEIARPLSIEIHKLLISKISEMNIDESNKFTIETFALAMAYAVMIKSSYYFTDGSLAWGDFVNNKIDLIFLLLEHIK